MPALFVLISRRTIAVSLLCLAGAAATGCTASPARDSQLDMPVLHHSLSTADDDVILPPSSQVAAPGRHSASSNSTPVERHAGRRTI